MCVSVCECALHLYGDHHSLSKLFFKHNMTTLSINETNIFIDPLMLEILRSSDDSSFKILSICVNQRKIHDSPKLRIQARAEG